MKNWEFSDFAQVFHLEGELTGARKAAGLPPEPPGEPMDSMQLPQAAAAPEPVKALLNGDNGELGSIPLPRKSKTPRP